MHLSLKGSLDRQPLVDRIGDKLLPTYPGAAAAYSLRALNGDANKVVRVRRASDNVERDFTAREVSSGDMVNWVNAQVVPPLDVRELVDGERTGDLIPAAAAYSLRNLSASYTGNVVDVRRSSDNLEESFTAAEVADGTLVDWVTEEQVGWNLEPTWQIASGGGSITSQSTTAETSTFTISNTGGDSLVRVIGKPNSILASAGDSVVINLDVSGLNATNPKVNLITAGSNTAVATQAISNGSNQEFTLTPSASVGYINFSKFNTTIEASITINSIKVIGKSGFVETWYDQSGNDNHATQTAPSSQPKIVDAGVLVDGGMLFDGVDDFLEANDVAPSFSGTDIPLSCFAVNNYASITTGAKAVASLGNSSNSKPAFYFGKSNAGGHTLFFRDGSNATASIDFGNTAISTNYLTSAFNDGANQAQFVDGGAAGTTNIDLGLTPLDRFTIGALGRTTNSLYVNASVSEIIVYDSNQSDNRTALEANIGETYGIDLPSGVDTGYDEVDGFVETWYDQSGNEGNDAVQTVITKQPKIVDAGALVDGGIDFDGVDDFLETTQGYIVELSQNPASVFCVGSAGGSYMLTEGDGALPAYSSQFILNFTDLDSTLWVNSALFGSSFPVGKALGGFIYDGTNFQAYMNGSTDGSSGTAAINTETSVNSFIGSRADGTTYFFTGKIEELITYKSDQSANRTAIEDNINNHYEIY